MADTKLSALTELAATPAVDDEVYIRDVSEAAADESKRITVANLIASVNLVQSKLLSHTRAYDAATGDVAYDGYGFQPTALIIMCTGVGTQSIGFGDVNLSEMCMAKAANVAEVWTVDTAKIIYAREEASVKEQYAVLKTLDADGFTLTWTRVGTTSAGTLTMAVLAMK